MAITRRAMLKSRMNSPGATMNSGTVSVLEMAKMDLAKQRQKAQVVLRHNVLTPVKYVKPVKQSSGALECKSAHVTKSSLAAKPQVKSAAGQMASGAKMKIVTPRLPWNKGNVPSRTDSGLSRSASLPKSIRPRLRQSDSSVQTTQVTLKKSASTTAANTSTKVVMRRGKTRSIVSEQTTVKRRSRSFDSLFEGRHSGIPDISPTQCFKCRKELSKTSSFSSYSKLSVEDYTPFSSVSDVYDPTYCSSQDLLNKDENNNTIKYLDERPTKLSKNAVYMKAPVIEIVSDTECYGSRNYESDVSQTDSEYAFGGVVSDTEFYARKSRMRDKRHLYLDSPIPAMFDDKRKSESNASIEERKMKVENDLDSLLDSMAFVLGNKSGSSDTKKETEFASAQACDDYSPPMFFRPIFEVKI